MKRRHLTTILFLVAAISTTAYSVEYLPDKAGVTSALGEKTVSPYAGRVFPTRVLCGDTHLHTTRGGGHD